MLCKCLILWDTHQQLGQVLSPQRFTGFVRVTQQAHLQCQSRLFTKYPLVNKQSYWKLPFIVDLPIKNDDFPVRYETVYQVAFDNCYWKWLMKRVDLPIPNGDFPVRKLLVYQMVIIKDANEYSYNIRTVRKYVYYQYVHTQTVKRSHTATWLLKLPVNSPAMSDQSIGR